MRKTGNSDHQERGFGHIGIILAIVGVITVGALVAWRYMGATDSSKNSTDAISQQLAQAKCEYDDKDLCKFFVSWKMHETYRMATTTTDKETGDKTTMTYEVDGDNARSIMTGEFASETISIGSKTIYTKSSNGTWWKQTITETEKTNTSDIKIDLDEPTSEEAVANNGPKTTYKSLGTEACGSFTCFKYQVVYPDEPGTTEYIWFDTKNYQIRRTTTENASSLTDTSFSFDSVSVKAPSSFKELGPNQYLMPGEAEPQTVPTSGDFE